MGDDRDRHRTAPATATAPAPAPAAAADPGFHSCLYSTYAICYSTSLATPREGKKHRLSSKQTTARNKPRDLTRHPLTKERKTGSAIGRMRAGRAISDRADGEIYIE